MPHRPAIQDLYPQDVAHCFGCGRLNPRGHQLKTHWDGDETVSRFTPEPFHTAIPGYVYGGLIASLVDCHGTGTAAAAKAREMGLAEDAQPPRFVTGSLKVDYLKPTPLGVELEIRGRAVEVGAKKVVVEVTVRAGQSETVRGTVVAVVMPEALVKDP